MTAPFFKFGMFGDETSLLVAFAIGIGFGFFLERAGFASARKLMAQFYLTDLAVFKVMFTAILTAMLGVIYLSWIGMLDLSLVYLTPTFVLPQIVGGLVFGVGHRQGRRPGVRRRDVRRHARVRPDPARHQRLLHVDAAGAGDDSRLLQPALRPRRVRRRAGRARRLLRGRHRGTDHGEELRCVGGSRR